jgi:hypothetical protein
MRRPYGLRREAKRHAAFVRPKVLHYSIISRACESAVAAVALPAQSRTLPSRSRLIVVHPWLKNSFDYDPQRKNRTFAA